MTDPNNTYPQFNPANPLSIYDFSRHLIGHSLHSLFGEAVKQKEFKGKGGLGQMVEELFFGYSPNSNRQADFSLAGVELKCTPLKRTKTDPYAVKERLVCTMIDYFEIVNTCFEDSHLLAKCRLMLLLYYMHVQGQAKFDYEFIFRILWQLPDKDIIQLKQDYDTIADKVRRGEAHLLSEGDTLYLGACRKGQKGDSLQQQPCSDIGAKKRAFSLKTAYQRYILNHVLESGTDCYTNYIGTSDNEYQLVSADELRKRSFEDIIRSRFEPYIGHDYVEMCNMLEVEPYQSKSKYADIAGLIASCGQRKRLDEAEEFKKSGITMKTIRLRRNGSPKEAMSFHNIDYFELMDNDEWETSDAYELFTTRFMFVVLTPIDGRTITLHNRRTNEDVTEQAYAICDVFFWTMPTEDLEQAKEYWQHIRDSVKANRICLDAFWSISDDKKFHVRPKGQKADKTTENPHGGQCPKFCYWLNADYVKSIIKNHRNRNV